MLKVLKAKKIAGRFWLFIREGCEVVIFDLGEPSWKVANYCLLRFGYTPEWVTGD